MRLFTGLAALFLAMAVVAPTRADVVSADAQGVVIHLAAEVAAGPMESWKALTVPSRWWSNAHTFSGDAANLYIDSQATGCFCEKLPLPGDAPEGQRPGSVEHMHIVFANPGKALRMVGALGPLQSEAVHGTLTIVLKPVEGGTRIVWEYVFGGFVRKKPEDIAAAVDAVLQEQLSSLSERIGPLKSVAKAQSKDSVKTEATAETEQASPSGMPDPEPEAPDPSGTGEGKGD